MERIKIFILTLLMILSFNKIVFANEDVNAIREEIKVMKELYESRITQLEEKLSDLEKQEANKTSDQSIISTRTIKGNEFNPSIGLVLNGKYNNFSTASSEIKGFGVGEEGERGREGLLIDESELNFSGYMDDKFYGSLTAAIVREDGADKVELEEAYLLTTPDANLPPGMSIKAGRAFWTLGYLNEHHAHADDFADRPLPYRVYLNKAFNDDGLEVTYTLPTDYYMEIGGGIFRGDDTPLGGADGENFGGYSTFARIGGDIDINQNWRLGVYTLKGKAPGGRTSNEDEVTFTGDKTDLYVLDFRYSLAPTGNVSEQEFVIQTEYFGRDEAGTYNDTGSSTGDITVDGESHGWYAQATYKFDSQYRIGARYSEMVAPGVPTGLVGSALDDKDHDPNSVSLMADWTNSEFSRIRVQYNENHLNSTTDDTQFILQYIMSYGAHGAHKY